MVDRLNRGLPAFAHLALSVEREMLDVWSRLFSLFSFQGFRVSGFNTAHENDKPLAGLPRGDSRRSDDRSASVVGQTEEAKIHTTSNTNARAIDGPFPFCRR